MSLYLEVRELVKKRMKKLKHIRSLIENCKDLEKENSLGSTNCFRIIRRCSKEHEQVGHQNQYSLLQKRCLIGFSKDS